MNKFVVDASVAIKCRNIIAIEVKRQAGIFSTSTDIVTKMEYYPI